MQTYEDGTQARLGDIVMGDGKPTKYMVVGLESHSATLLPVGIVTKGNPSLIGKTIVIPGGQTRTRVPLSGFTRLGYAEIKIVEGSMPSNVGDAE